MAHPEKQKARYTPQALLADRSIAIDIIKHALPASGSATGTDDGIHSSVSRCSTRIRSRTVSDASRGSPQPLRNVMPARAEANTMDIIEWPYETMLEHTVRIGLSPKSALPESWQRNPPYTKRREPL